MLRVALYFYFFPLLPTPLYLWVTFDFFKHCFNLLLFIYILLYRLAESNPQSARYHSGQLHGPPRQWSHRLQARQTDWNGVQSGAAQWLTGCSRDCQDGHCRRPQWISNAASNWVAHDHADVEYTGKINTGTRNGKWVFESLLCCPSNTYYFKHTKSPCNKGNLLSGAFSLFSILFLLNWGSHFQRSVTPFPFDINCFPRNWRL